ncbi:MAG: tyrosine-type recombinase/integrase, partial [Woeseia sp.]
RSVTGSSRFLFPSLRSKQRPISDNTLNAALRRMGYTKEQMTSHGFRTSASTLLHELGFPPDVIETQLAHKRAGVEGIYNRSHLLEQRTNMMQKWADYLDSLAIKEESA